MLDELNSHQKQAVTTVEGPVLIIAGAGSGKTRTLTYRIAHLLRDCGVDPYHILAVTFTNKAATEMRERVEKLLGQKIGRQGFVPDLSESPLISTFHSFGVRLLRAEGKHIGIDPKFVIYDQVDTRALIKKSALEAGIDIDRWKPQQLAWLISAAKNDGLSPSQLAAKATEVSQTVAAQVYEIYQQKMRAAGALDFDDLLTESVRLFEKCPAVLEKYQERFQFLLVDEYQDTNLIQYRLVQLLAQKYRNLCVVGDDDQSIYAWRGADVRNILDFEKDFPQAKVIKLEQNYRSTGNILAAAHAVISRNSQRKPKKLWTEAGDGDKISVIEAYSGRDEAAQIVAEIQSSTQNSGARLADFAVLYRTNAQSRVLEEAFLNAGIPYQIVGGTRFYERKEIKDILAYLRLLTNSLDDVSFARIVNVPPRKIGAVTVDKLNAFATFNGVPLWDTLGRLDKLNLAPLASSSLAKFGALMRKLKTELQNPDTKLSDFLKQLIAKTGFEKYLLDGTDEGESRYENILELLSVAKRYEEMSGEAALQAFLEEVALVTDLDTIAAAGEAVTLMTMHTAKGLEFPTVFVAGMEEEILPHSMSLADGQAGIEEERRLCYVALTRAMKKLFLCHASERLIFGQVKTQRPSRFLEDIPADLLDKPLGNSANAGIFATSWDDGIQYVADDDLALPDFEIGERVRHPVFGTGQIVEIVGRVVSVRFERGGIKKILGEKLGKA